MSRTAFSSIKSQLLVYDSVRNCMSPNQKQ